MQLTCPASDLMMCAVCVSCQRLRKASISCACHGTYTCVVEFVGFDHGSVVTICTSEWCVNVDVLSIRELCAMKRVLVGVHINNAATNKTWKPRHDHGISAKLWNSLFLSLQTRKVELGKDGNCALHCTCHYTYGIGWHLPLQEPPT